MPDNSNTSELFARIREQLAAIGKPGGVPLHPQIKDILQDFSDHEKIFDSQPEVVSINETLDQEIAFQDDTKFHDNCNVVLYQLSVHFISCTRK